VLELARGERLLSDQRLARLASRGSARAFAVLYERHHQAIYRYCRAIVRDDQDAEDALQSAMTRAYAALCARERDLAVRPWLFRIAHNEAISILRRRPPEHVPSEACEALDGGGVERTLELRERLALLVADLHALPERQRAALLMRELSGLSIVEIAGAMSISVGAAKQTLFEARNSLRELAEGRTMECESVREAISLRDGRVLRGRRIRSHLRACAGCREFRTAIGAREADLRSLAPPLPASAASAMLARLLAHGGGGGHAGGAAVASSAGASLGGHAAAPLLAKGIAGVAVLAAATAGAVHLTTHRHHHRAAVTSAAAPVARAAVGWPRDAGGRGGLSSDRLQPQRSRPAGSSLHARASTGANHGPPGTGEHPHGSGVSRAQASVSVRSVHGSPGRSPGDRAAGKGRSGAGVGHRAAGHGSHSATGHHSSAHHEPARHKSTRRSHGEARHGASDRGSAAPAGEAPGHGASGGQNHQQVAQETRGAQVPATRGK
jgi:RNA polymerase sigma factor (sigma-70 family)